MTLKARAIASFGWNGFGNVARQVILIVQMIVMARFITPADFGLYGLLMIFAEFANFIGQLGAAQSVIYLENTDQRMLSSVFLLNVFIGGLLFAGFGLSAPLVSNFFGGDELVKPLVVVGGAIFVVCLSNVHRATLEKALRFRRLAIIEIASIYLASAIGIAMAIQGFKLYSLVAVYALNAIFLTVSLWLFSGWRPSLTLSWNDIKKVIGYTTGIIGYNTTHFLMRNSDNFLIGKFIGATGLGTYGVTYRIMLYPLDNIAAVIVRVLFPALSQIKNDNARVKRGYLRVIYFITFLTFPMMFGLMAVADTFVGAVFGEKWLAMIPLIYWMAPVGAVQSFVTTVSAIYSAKGTTNLMLKVGLVNCALYIAGFALGLSHGIQGVAGALAIVTLLTLIPTLHFAWRQIDLSIKEGLATLMPALFVSLLMATLVFALGRIVPITDHLWLKLIVQVVFGGALYVLFFALFFKVTPKKLWAELRSQPATVNP